MTTNLIRKSAYIDDPVFTTIALRINQRQRYGPEHTDNYQIGSQEENTMKIRITPALWTVATLWASLWASGAAFAQSSSTSGPAAGTNVEPSTAIQKEDSGQVSPRGAPNAAGAPGVEAKPGVEGGRAPTKPKANEGAMPEHD